MEIIYTNDTAIYFNKEQIYSIIDYISVIDKFTISFLSYEFLDQNDMLSLNNEVFNHDYYTDIITLQSVFEQYINSNIYICTDMIHENSKLNNKTTENELVRVIFHGFLHSISYTDITRSDKQIMSSLENYCLSFYNCST